ncbi:MAG: response regulator transcription factor [Bacteroidetes bacterium]|jgi:two-component system alkaline phosphatase synthesis response regulator PhoP|nr:response regulator transcription factor [Bacteroidota bacterium]MBP6412247.1 response regulator transcription factor [Bacteroidia bacterium]MBK9671145.1 response regulator transcription factor [Bacteroidota bacterium]MBK9798813.1 response regulator transcription factor [Bacteroidota bacterium]HRH02119.1 response regulator transcription factor [Bacteroidia bacterium]
MATEGQTILLVDDDTDILEFLSYNLRKEGYRVLTADNGKQAVEIALQEKPQLILLDVMMPGMDGVETCNQLRENSELQQVIIAFLTARNEDYSQIAGFEVGADDYISKPIKPRVLISRIKALLRRNRNLAPAVENLHLGGIVIDREQYCIEKDGEKIYLPKKEFELLALLSSKPGKVFTREHILSQVWGDDVVVGDRTIDVHIRKLREKLGDTYIKTVKGVGYKFDF